MSEIQFVDGNQVLHGHGIFLDIKLTSTSEIYDTIILERSDYFSNPIILGTRPIVNQISKLDIIIRSSVIRIYNRQSI